MFVNMYCWDYATFNSGIEEEDLLSENASFQRMANKEKLSSLENLRTVRIHRSQLVECTTYIKILLLKCNNLLNLEISTDQNFQPQRATLFYNNLTFLLQQNANSLKSLAFPYKTIGQTFDFRLIDEHHSFSFFINFINDRKWEDILNLNALENLSIQFGIVPIEDDELETKLVPLLHSMPSLRNFSLSCLFLEAGKESHVDRLIQMLKSKPNNEVNVKVNIFVNDVSGPFNPNVTLSKSMNSLSIQTFRDISDEVQEVLPMLGDVYPQMKELQYFSKSHSFKSYSWELLLFSFPNLTHLNLIDHNARLETRHPSESLATIEDEDMQLIIESLQKLQYLQIVGNCAYLTDTGMTGISRSGCKRLTQELSVEPMLSDCDGHPISYLSSLRAIVLRGLGIKITNITAYCAFMHMPHLKKLHLYGCTQITPLARTALCYKYSISKGCDTQV